MLKKPEKKKENTPNKYVNEENKACNQTHNLWQAYHTQEIECLTLSPDTIKVFKLMLKHYEERGGGYSQKLALEEAIALQKGGE